MAKRKVGLFSTHIQGIPCQIDVTCFTRVKGSFSRNAESDWDYYGYEEFEFDVYDRKGYPAPWLQRKMTPLDEERIYEEYTTS